MVHIPATEWERWEMTFWPKAETSRKHVDPSVCYLLPQQHIFPWNKRNTDSDGKFYFISTWYLVHRSFPRRAHVHLLHVRIQWPFGWIPRSNARLDGCVYFSFLHLTRHCETEERFSRNTLSLEGTQVWDLPAWPKDVVGSGIAEGIILARTISQMLVWPTPVWFYQKGLGSQSIFYF